MPPPAAASYRPALFTPNHIGWDDGIVIAGLDYAILILRSMCLSLQANQSVKLYWARNYYLLWVA